MASSGNLRNDLMRNDCNWQLLPSTHHLWLPATHYSFCHDQHTSPKPAASSDMCTQVCRAVSAPSLPQNFHDWFHVITLPAVVHSRSFICHRTALHKLLALPVLQTYNHQSADLKNAAAAEERILRGARVRLLHHRIMILKPHCLLPWS